MRRLLCAILAVFSLYMLAGCSIGKKGITADTKNTSASAATSKEAVPTAGNTRMQDATHSGNSESAKITGETEPQTTSGGSSNSRDSRLLQSASIDLDGDGTSEQIEVYQKIIKPQDSGESDELEGILRISGNKGISEIPVVRKPAGFADTVSSIEFQDLDGDGAKDVFMVLPDNGASFSLDYFFIYDYKTGKSYSYATDANLSDFASSFSFKYAGNGKLRMDNAKYAFSAVFDLTGSTGGKPANDDYYEGYDRSWVEPAPVEISEDSRLALEKASDGSVEIKVPLPVFGLATADMIGEVDLYYKVDSNFEPVMKHFTVIGFNGGKLDKLGEHSLE